MSLGRLLIRYTPANPSLDVAETYELLVVEVNRYAQAFADRHREYGPSIAAEEFDIDTVVDVLLHILRDRCVNWEVFDRPAIHKLAAKQKPNGFDFAAKIEKAKLARRVYAQLFAAGLDWTKLPYGDQAEHMRVLDRIIAEEQLAGTLDELVGESFTQALRECHVEYYEMVERRSVRAQGSAVNLRALGLDLQRSIQNYQIALLAMIRDNDSVIVEQLRRALRPVDALREQLQRERLRGEGVTGETVDEEDAAVIEELVADQQAFDAELGLPPEGPTEAQAVVG